MKHIKIFKEAINNYSYVKTGDFIILNKYESGNNSRLNNETWTNFLRNTIGKVKRIYYTTSGDKQITIVYDTKDVPRDLQNTYVDYIDGKFQRNFDYDSIENFITSSNNIDDLNLILTANKYNL